MDFLIELLFDLGIEGCIEASNSKKVPKPIRILLGSFVILFYLIVIGLIILLGVDCIHKNLLGGIIVISVGVLILILSIRKFYLTYKEKRKGNN